MFHLKIRAYLPGLAWVGFDPANNVIAAERHIRSAIDRDYSDVPPTRGVFRGEAASELAASVMVSLPDVPVLSDRFMPMTTWVAPQPPDQRAELEQQQQQQQQQQQ